MAWTLPGNNSSLEAADRLGVTTWTEVRRGFSDGWLGHRCRRWEVRFLMMQRAIHRYYSSCNCGVISITASASKTLGCFRRIKLYTTGTKNKVAKVATNKPPMTARPSGA